MIKNYYINAYNITISYDLIRSYRKTLGIKIDNNGNIKIFAPINISNSQIDEIINKKAKWIIEKSNQMIKIKQRLDKVYSDGKKILYLGDEYHLKLVKTKLRSPKISIEDKNIVISMPEDLMCDKQNQLIKDLLRNWYIERFRNVVIYSVEKYSAIIGVLPKNINIKEQKTKWGSCSSLNNINLNWRLIMAPIKIIDYVIVHELCHLKIMNHSKDFWNLIHSILPDYELRREWLKKNGYMLAM